MSKVVKNHRKGDMFNDRVRDERIGHLRKTEFVHELQPVESCFLHLAEKHGINTSYDVVADEALHFETLSYTEWGSNFLVSPLQYEVRVDCIKEAQFSPEPTQDWVGYYKQVLKDKNANKYTNREEPRHEPRENVVILVGTNKLKSSIDIEKLQWLARQNDGKIWFKPHPLTTWEYIGFLQDKLGWDNVLERDEDMYFYLENAKKVYSTHFSESLLYASVLGKQTEPVDIYKMRMQGGFYHLNNFLFKNQFNEDYAEQINRVLSCSRSGVFNPRIDPNWKNKMDMYFEYIMDVRSRYHRWYRPHKLNKK